nr:hypothetical protein CFP56_31157 [Quercus suber]
MREVRGDFRPNASDHRAVTENVKGCLGGSTADGTHRVICDFSIMEERFGGEAIMTRKPKKRRDSWESRNFPKPIPAGD